MRLSQSGLDFIKQHEKRPHEEDVFKAYKDSVGKWTIGYGNTRNVNPYMVINKKEAERLLNKDLERHQERVNRLVKHPLTQSQFDALVSFDFNTGGLRYIDPQTNKAVDSELLKHLNKGNVDQAFMEELPKWDKGTIKGQKTVIPGLSNRRRAEQELAYKNENENNYSPIPTDLLDKLLNRGNF
jgi:lysozyme